jgi:hypothetical protein
MQTQLSTEERVSRIDDLERRSRFMQWVLGILLVVVCAVPFITYWWISSIQSDISGITITNAHIVGDSDVCGGELLVLAYNFHAEGTGKLIEDATVWRTLPPPKTVIYSDSRPFLLDETIDQETTLAWRVPLTYTNPATGAIEPLPPGKYRRLFSVGSTTRFSQFAQSSVEFSVCEK